MTRPDHPHGGHPGSGYSSSGHRALSDPRWRERGSCAQIDPELFFPRPGQNITTARRICAACPVRADCLTDALSSGDVHFGVRAGLTARQRRQLRRALRHQTGAADPTDLADAGFALAGVA